MLRVAAIEFLNAAPLMWGLEADARFSLRHTLPSACADALRDGAADLGVIPVIELARVPELVGLDGLGVAAGAEPGSQVRSILLVSRPPAAAVRRVALDRASRTSAALVQILLRHRFGADFTVVPGDADWRRALGLPRAQGPQAGASTSGWPAAGGPGPAPIEAAEGRPGAQGPQAGASTSEWPAGGGPGPAPIEAAEGRPGAQGPQAGASTSGWPAGGGPGPAPINDAALLIGDPALRLRISGEAEAAGLHVYDLAQEWQTWTGLPFVFALWGIRPAAFAAHQGWLPQRLWQALEEGSAHREALVAQWAPRLGLDAGEVRRYLADNVVHRLLPAHRAGLRRFLELAAADGLAPEAPLRLVEAVPA